jgi:hypothetical protein
MSWFGDLVKGGMEGLIGSIGGVADRFIQSDDEKAAFQIEVQKLVQARMSEIEETARAELDAKQRIMTAELQQGDKFTKRARPTTVYFGLGVIFYNYCFIPTIGLFLETPPPLFELPTEFWAAWGGIVATWSIGRSAEKRGSMNRLTSLITGSKRTNSLLD